MSYIGQGNKVYNNYLSYSGHIYWEPRTIKIKVEFASIIDKNSAKDITTNGYYFMGAYEIYRNVELLGRFEFFDPYTDLDNNEEVLYTLGASYCLFPGNWVSSKITAECFKKR